MLILLVYASLQDCQENNSTRFIIYQTLCQMVITTRNSKTCMGAQQPSSTVPHCKSVKVNVECLFTPTAQYANNVKLVLQCHECEKWRLIYCNCRLSPKEKSELSWNSWIGSLFVWLRSPGHRTRWWINSAEGLHKSKPDMLVTHWDTLLQHQCTWTSLFSLWFWRNNWRWYKSQRQIPYLCSVSC